MPKHTKSLCLILLLAAALGVGSFAFAHGLADVSTILGLTPPTILPSSPFYFLKDIGRGLERLFTFDPVKKAGLELSITDEKLNELAATAEKKPEAKDALEKALTNYLDSQKRLRARLEALKDKNKNVDDLLQKLADRVIDHEKIFASLEEKFSKDETAETTAGIAENAKQALQLNAEKFKEKLKARLNAEAGDEKKEALEAVKKVKDTDKELENKLEDVDEVAAAENTAKANPTADEARAALSKWQKEIQEYENDLAKISLSAKDAAEANLQLAEAKKHWGFAKDAFDKGNYAETLAHTGHVKGFLEKLKTIIENKPAGGEKPKEEKLQEKKPESKIIPPAPPSAVLSSQSPPAPSETLLSVEADDLGFYPSDTLSLAKGMKTKLTFLVRASRVYFGGLDFRSSKFAAVSAKPGDSATVEFTADESFTISSYWPTSGVKKADVNVVVK